MHTTITFWGGLHTIGGNIAEIAYGNNRVIFDFGLVYNPESSIINTADHRKQTYVMDLLKLKAIPAIDGIYSKESIGGPFYSTEKPIPAEDSSYKTSIFISHLHLDHMGAIDTISPAIPVYMTENSKQLYQKLEKVGEGLPLKREVCGLSFGEAVQIGNISVTPFPVDHDIIGAASYLIETPDLRVLYSGDLRLHGAHSEYIEEWLHKMKLQAIDILLMEGTSFRPESVESGFSLCKREGDITEVAKEILHETAGLALFNIYHRNTDRIRSFLAAAKSANRIPVLEVETAYIADEFLDEPNFMVYIEDPQAIPSLAKKLLKKHVGISPTIINKKPNSYLLQNSYHHISRLLDLNLMDSVYLHSNGMPLGTFDPAFQTMHSVLKHFGVVYRSLDVSGHASTEAILYMIDQIKPRLLIPWHSHYPELLKPLDENQAVFYPELKVDYIYRDGKLAQR